MNEISPQDWAGQVKAWMPRLLEAQPQLARVIGEGATVLLHGSLTLDGAADEHSDVDVWVLTDQSRAAHLREQIGACFIDFEAFRHGHFQVKVLDEFACRIAACDLPLIAELRDAVTIADPKHLATPLIAAARKPMSDDVRLAWFRYHYVEMRGEHRACDGAITRRQPIPLLLAVAPVLDHALRAAMVLDRVPYRYVKWLPWMAARTRTGAKVMTDAEDTLKLIERGALRDPTPEATHVINLALKRIRQTLIDAARSAGIDARWLAEWWLHLDEARSGIHDVTW
jgi:hypothetical protein